MTDIAHGVGILRDLVRQSFAAEYGDRVADAVLETLEYGNARDMAELDAWIDGRLTYDPNPVVAPFRRGSDSASRAGTLSRGQWRGIPVSPRGVIQQAPGDSYYAPGDGKALIRARVAAYREAIQARAAQARECRAMASARRVAYTAKVGTKTTCGTYCAGYRPSKRK
jgi:hypothetical protein